MCVNHNIKHCTMCGHTLIFFWHRQRMRANISDLPTPQLRNNRIHCPSTVCSKPKGLWWRKRSCLLQGYCLWEFFWRWPSWRKSTVRIFVLFWLCEYSTIRASLRFLTNWTPKGHSYIVQFEHDLQRIASTWRWNHTLCFFNLVGRLFEIAIHVVLGGLQLLVAS